MTPGTPAEVFPPGEFLREELEARGWTQDDLAEIIGCNVRTVNEIVNARRGITTETAIGLAAAFDMSPDFWLSLEQAYQLWLNRGKNTYAVSRRATIYNYAPVKEMEKRGWITGSENVDVLEASVLKFYGIPDFTETPELALAARKSNSYDDDFTPTQLAWLVRARNLGSSLQAGEFTVDAAREAVSKLRLLLSEPVQVKHVTKILAEAGIRFVIVAPLTGVQIDGACIWLAPDAPVVALSIRFNRIDCFWFTLLHEMKHVIERHTSVDVDLEKTGSEENQPEEEKMANAFAAENLVPRSALNNFIVRKRPLYSRIDIEGFARRQNVHPGIVVGQLQARGEMPYANLRKLLVPIRDFIIASALTDGWGMVAQ